MRADTLARLERYGTRPTQALAGGLSPMHVEVRPVRIDLSHAQVTVDAPAAPAPALTAPVTPQAPVARSGGLSGTFFMGVSSVTCFGLAAAQSSHAIAPELVAPLFFGAIACAFVGLIKR